LASEKDQSWSELRKTNLPIFINGNIFHDLFTVF
jgi:hypothetical protein